MLGWSPDGKIEVYDLASGTVSRPAITIGAEAPSVRPHSKDLAAGVRIALDALAKSPPPTFVQPPAPDKKPVLPDTID